ncbi:MAG: DUF3108 domain-containing protein [Pontiellaceae bacterium]|nr:DUF3108 domain-containing protein [Pontiellaceae bacterium]MBN2784378.1 DUF3108 domain-containing protein [Pontiellaceae bacterium]
MRRRLFFSLLALLLPASPFLHAEEIRFPIGEQATYSIHWGLLNCGTSTFRCEEIEENGKTMIRVRVQARSNWLVSTIYPVEDTVDCYIDPATGQSVRLEKSTSEGEKICRDILTIDRENNTAEWISESDNISTNYPIEAGACDAVSFLYAFRAHAFTPDVPQPFSIVVDTALHGITITAGGTDRKKVGALGKVLCRRYTVAPERDDLFVRKIPQMIWLSDDERKILIRMDLKVPVGKARIELDEYIPPLQR